MLASREPARRAGTGPRSDHTIEAGPGDHADLALFLVSERGKHDRTLADVHNIEALN
jgi:hypothetical protein